jgi:phage terminase large subunit-like protein
VHAKSLPSVSDTDILREYATRWAFIAHAGQIPPENRAWFCYLMRSGRGGGKTRSGSEWILKRVRQGYKHIALIGQTAADVRDTMVELGPSSIMKIARPEERPIYEPSKRRLTFPNGAIATTFTGEEPDQLRGPAHDTVWIDELAKFKYPEETWDNMEMGLRLGDNPQVFCTTTPRPIPIIKRLIKDPTTIDIRFSTSQNAENLSPIFLKRVQERYAGTRLGRQELEGEILEDNPNALFQRAIIENLRVTEGAVPQLIRVVVGMDPAVTGTKTSDETGIIAGGIAANGHGYIIEDASLQASPAEWARAGVRVFHARRADRIIGEVNNGGDLIEVNIRTVDRNIPYTAVHASRGKAIRAEPVAALYEQGRIHHVGTFPMLEDQMCDWSPGDAKSPDRMDALVWTIWELFGLGLKEEQQRRVYVISDDTEI